MHDQLARMKQLEKQIYNNMNNPRPVDVKVKRIHTDAIIPTKANNLDAGWDLYAVEEVTIDDAGPFKVNTGIQMEIPNGYVGLIWPRSGLAVKKNVDVLAGVIDAGYRGEIIVCLQCVSASWDNQVVIKPGDKVAQMLFHRVPNFHMLEVGKLSNTERGESGFGSSGR